MVVHRRVGGNKSGGFSNNALLCYVDQVVVISALRDSTYDRYGTFPPPGFPMGMFRLWLVSPTSTPASWRMKRFQGGLRASSGGLDESAQLYHVKVKPLPSPKNLKGSIGDLVFVCVRCSTVEK